MTPTKRVTLDPSESQGVAFVYTPQEAKTYHVAINGLSGSFEATEAPVEEYPFTYEDLEISAPVVVGYPVTIGCRVMLCIAPVGRPITHTVTLYINNTPVLTQEVTLVREFLCAQTRVEFQFTPGSTRTYRVEIDGLTGSFTAVLPIFVNTPPELVKSALEFPDEVIAAYTRTQGDFSGPFLSGASELREPYFTFDPTAVIPPNANLNCIIGLDLGGYSGWNLGATLIAIRASEYESWLNNITFLKWGVPGRLGQGIYGLGFPKITVLPDGSERIVGSTCGDYDCQAISHSESYGGWQGCNLRSGDHEVNVNGLLNLEPGSWVVLASFTMSICNAFLSPGPKGTEHMTYLPLDCRNYKIYRIGTIDF